MKKPGQREIICRAHTTSKWWRQLSHSGHRTAEPHSKSLWQTTWQSTQNGRWGLPITGWGRGRGFRTCDSPVLLLSSMLTNASTQRAVRKEKWEVSPEWVSHYFQVNESLLKLKAFSEDRKTPISNTFISVLNSLCVKASRSIEVTPEPGAAVP